MCLDDAIAERIVSGGRAVNPGQIASRRISNPQRVPMQRGPQFSNPEPAFPGIPCPDKWLFDKAPWFCRPPFYPPHSLMDPNEVWLWTGWWPGSKKAWINLNTTDKSIFGKLGADGSALYQRPKLWTGTQHVIALAPDAKWHWYVIRDKYGPQKVDPGFFKPSDPNTDIASGQGGWGTTRPGRGGPYPQPVPMQSGPQFSNPMKSRRR